MKERPERSTEGAAWSITVDKDSATPLRSQIREALSRRISTGELPGGMRLPSVRDFAKQLGVSTITVSHAYQDLARSGAIASEVGRGTVVAWSANRSPDADRSGSQDTVEWWASSLATYNRAPRTTILRGILAAGAASNQTLLTDSHPDVSQRLAKGFAHAMRTAAKGPDEELLRPVSALGLPDLRRALAETLLPSHIPSRGDPAGDEQVLVTSGDFTALRSVVSTFVGPRDSVVVEHPTYFRALDLLEEKGAALLMVPTDEMGLRTDVLARVVRVHHPKLIYLTHPVHNPTGVTMHADRQRALLEIAAEHHIPVVEDASGSGYWFEGTPSTLLGLDGQGIVIQLGSLTHLIAAGVRLGYIASSGLLLKKLAASILATDMWSAPFLQRAAAIYLSSPYFKSDLRTSIAAARERRDAVLETLRANAPDGVQWSIPVGGFNVWITFPSRTPGELLVEAGRRAGVALLPASMFTIEELPDPAVRLSYARHEPAVLRDVVRRLCLSWHDMLRGKGAPSSISSEAIMA